VFQVRARPRSRDGSARDAARSRSNGNNAHAVKRPSLEDNNLVSSRVRTAAPLVVSRCKRASKGTSSAITTSHGRQRIRVLFLVSIRPSMAQLTRKALPGGDRLEISAAHANLVAEVPIRRVVSHTTCYLVRLCHSQNKTKLLVDGRAHTLEIFDS